MLLIYRKYISLFLNNTFPSYHLWLSSPNQCISKLNNYSEYCLFSKDSRKGDRHLHKRCIPVLQVSTPPLCRFNESLTKNLGFCVSSLDKAPYLDICSQSAFVNMWLFCASTADHVFSASFLYVCFHAERLLAFRYYVLTLLVDFKGQRENYSFRHQLAALGRASCLWNCIVPYRKELLVKKSALKLWLCYTVR